MGDIPVRSVTIAIMIDDTNKGIRNMATVDLNKTYNPATKYGQFMIAEQNKLRGTSVGHVAAPVITESDEEIEARIEERFDILEYLTAESMEGNVRALIVSGPAGLGKSHTVETALAAWDPSEINHKIIKGFAKATGLFKTLYEFRDAGKVIVFDDCDSIFSDETALNMLKAVCDTTERRRVSYLSEAVLRNDEGDALPNTFEFEGTIIFITNYDFDEIIEKGNKLAPHMAAMMSRAHYVDLAMKSRNDYLVRIKQVIKQGLLTQKGLSDNQMTDVCEFIDSHADRLRELSLRVALKIADVRKGNKPNWSKIAEVTCCKAA